MSTQAAALPSDVAPEDDALVQRMAQGDQWALKALYDRYAGRLTALSLRVLRVRGDAEEIVQETFVEAWKRAREFDRGRGSVGAWLTTIARTRAIDRLRAGVAARRAVSGAAHEASDPPARPDDEAGARQERLRVRGALAGLPAEQRETLELAYFEGLSQSEIAERTGQPLGTVKTRVRLGLAKLFACLTDLGRTP